MFSISDINNFAHNFGAKLTFFRNEHAFSFNCHACMAWIPSKILYSILFLQDSHFGSSLKNN